MAPEIAFARRLQSVEIETVLIPFWMKTTLISRCISAGYREAMEKLMRENPDFERFGDAAA